MLIRLVRETPFGNFILTLQTSQRGHSVVTEHYAEVKASLDDALDLLKVGYTQFCQQNEVRREG